MKDIFFQGLTGLVYFTANSHRFVQNLSVREINSKLGFWYQENEQRNVLRFVGMTITTTKLHNRRKRESSPLREMLTKGIRKKHLRIVNTPEAP